MDTTLPPAFDPALETHKELVAAKSAVSKKFSWAKFPSLIAAVHLAHLLVVFGKAAEADEICQALGRIQFSGEFSLWSAVERALALQARFARLRGDAAEAKTCLSRIRDAGFVERRLEGFMLDRNESIPEAIRTNDQKLERSARLGLAAEQVFIIELGGSAVRPVAGLEQDYAANVAALKTLFGIA